MTHKEFQEKVNPVFSTAKGTAGLLAGAGNPDAAAIVSGLDLSALPDREEGVSDSVKKGFAVSIEARYEISNKMILRENKPNIIDLPSGYTPRALFAAKEGKRYIGLDLPVVAEEISAIVRELIPSQYGKSAQYFGVDATNYASMSAALEQVEGEVCIVTDGLLVYFNEPEMLAVCDNVKRILGRFGGCWITGDITGFPLYSATLSVLFQDDPSLVDTFVGSTVNKMSDVTTGQNSLFEKGPHKAEEVLKGLGFHVERISFSELLPKLSSMAGDPEGWEGLKKAYESIEIWKLTLRDAADALPAAEKSGAFSADLNLKDAHLEITLGGRLDTLTAPELLEKYENVRKDHAISSVTVRAGELQYVSSAGLRVLLMIYKGLEEPDNFRFLDAKPEVAEILETTGFDQFFILEDI